MTDNFGISTFFHAGKKKARLSIVLRYLAKLICRSRPQVETNFFDLVQNKKELWL